MTRLKNIIKFWFDGLLIENLLLFLIFIECCKDIFQDGERIDRLIIIKSINAVDKRLILASLKKNLKAYCII